jgi:hypothetical protein
MMRTPRALAVALVLVAGCTGGGEKAEPLPDGHVPCPPELIEQSPGAQCVAPEHAQRLGAACSAHGATCVLGGILPIPDGIIDCPVVYPAPGSTDPGIVYTPPCVRKSLGGGAYYIYDGNGLLIGGGTP